MMRLAISVGVLCGLIACGEKSESSSSDNGISAGSGPLPASALAKPTGLGTLSRADVIIAMESNRSDFLATEAEVPEDEDTAEDDGEVDCAGDAFSNISVVAEGDTMTVDVNIDMTACLKAAWAEAGEGVTATVNKAVMSFYIRQTCVGADLSSYNEKSLEDIGDVPECDDNRILMNMASEMDAAISGNGESLEINSKSVNVFGTEANEPCQMTRSGEAYSQTGCVEIFKSEGPEGSEDNEYTKYTYNDLKWVASVKNTWYTSGTMAVEMNDWTGDVTFRGADVNPAYQMKYGTETINGTLTIPAGLYFKSSLQRALVRGMPRLKTAR